MQVSANSTNSQNHTILMSQELRLNIPLVSVQCSNSVKSVCSVNVAIKLSLRDMSKLGICVEALAYNHKKLCRCKGAMQCTTNMKYCN